MSNIPRIRKGSSLDFTFDLDGEDPSGWTCVIKVKQFPDDADSISRAIALDTNNQWSGFLTSTETAALANGAWWLIAVLSNATTLEGRQIPERFQIVETWVV